MNLSLLFIFSLFLLCASSFATENCGFQVAPTDSIKVPQQKVADTIAQSAKEAVFKLFSMEIATTLLFSFVATYCALLVGRFLYRRNA